MAAMVQLTVFGDPEERLETRYGVVTWRDYLGRECARIAALPGRQAAVVERHGQLALTVNDVSARAARPAASRAA